MPILGIYASANQFQYSTAYESIATVTVGAGGSSTVTFSSIPSGYKHLQIRGIARGDYAVSSPISCYFRFNSDAGNNYAIHAIYGDGSAVAAYNFTSVSVGYAGIIADAFNGANIFSPFVFDILDYSNTNKYKTTRSLTGYDANGTGQSVLVSSLWQSTSAINSITFGPGAGTNFQQYSSFALYGIKGA